MSNIENSIKSSENQGVSLKDLTQKIKVIWKYLLSKWIVIVIFGFGGAAIGLTVAILTKPDYKAHLSFSLIDNSGGGGGGLAALASSFGLGNFGMSEDAFSGDNLLEIIKSRYSIEQTLLTPVNYKNKKKNLVEVYIDFNELRDQWKNSKDVNVRNLSYPIGQKRETFSRTQDSVLFSIYSQMVKSGALFVARKDKKIGIVNVDFTSQDETFSKLFVEKLMFETYQFYKMTRTSQTKANVNMMEAKADSIKRLYESAIYRSATYSQLNLNAALPTAGVPKIKQESNAQLYLTVYTQVLANLESLKLDLAKQTPLVQMIDTPRYPLEKSKIGKVKGIIIGGLIGGFLIVFLLLAILYFKNGLKEDKIFLMKSSYN